MALYDSTTQDINSEFSAVYDNDGTADHQFSAVYDNDGTADHLVYSAMPTILNKGEVGSGLTFSRDRDSLRVENSFTGNGAEFKAANINTTLNLCWTTDPIDITPISSIEVYLPTNWVRLNGPLYGGNAEVSMWLMLINSKSQDVGSGDNVAQTGGRYGYNSAAESGPVDVSGSRRYTLNVSGISGTYCVRFRAYYYCIGQWNMFPSAYGTIESIICS